MLRKIDDRCGHLVPLKYFVDFFYLKKSARISLAFAASFGFWKKLKLGFSLQERIRKEIE